VLALRLARRGHRVTVIESGPRYSDEQKEKLFLAARAGRLEDNPYRLSEPSIEAYRNDGAVEIQLNYERSRGIGGTTLFWLGNTPRMLPDDFRMRSRFGVAEDWPVSYAELEPFYGQAEVEIGISGAPDNPFAAPRSTPYPMAPIPFSYADKLIKKATDRLGYDLHHTPQARNSGYYGGRSQCQACAYCQVCPTGAKATFDRTHALPAEQTGRVRFLTDATVQRLELDPLGRVRRAVYAGLDRVERAEEAELFILACGGIETPRLLLLSTSPQFPDGLANRSGAVGRYLMNHPVASAVGQFDESLYPFRVNFESSESFQFYATRTRDETAAFLWNVNNTGGGRPSELADGSGLWGDALWERIESGFGHYASLSAGIDQLPDERNRIRLDPYEVDYFGQPIPLITYAFDEYTQRGLDLARRTLAEVLTEAGARRAWGPADVWWPGHHMGTVRMGDDAARSVVDRNLRTHDVPNLYLVTTGVWAAGGCANPTLTLSALALRLAEHLSGG
jgi:choline dehydrogenase-like flavoprotein